MQRVFRSQLVERTTDYAERIKGLRQSEIGDGPASVLDRLTEAGIQALEHLRGTMQPEALERAVRLLAEAEAIHVVGQRRAFAVAAYLAASQVPSALPYALAFAAGGFLYVAMADLIPGLHTHHQANHPVRQTLLIAAGIATMLLV